MTTPAEPDVYRTSSKQILVTRDPIYTHPSIKQGHFIGRKPNNYMYLAIFITVLNPLLGPIAILFAYMSSKAYRDGDIIYATKWSNYTLLSSMIIIVTTIVIAIAVCFALFGPNVRGGHSY